MSVGQGKGGLPPDRLVEDEDHVLADSQRLIEAYHDPSRHAMLRIVLAPCSPFSVSPDLMRATAALARSADVGLHTHLAENVSDVEYGRDKFNATPAEYAEAMGWVGPDVWHAHCVHLDQPGIDVFARTRTGVAHCPCSNMRLGSGIAPVRRMRDAGLRIGLGVDGSASNDGASMVGEARQAMLLQRVAFGPAALTARGALEMATVGGAAILNRDDIGYLAPGMSADFVAFDLRQLSFAGALHDPVAALLFCPPPSVALSVVNGRVVVRDGQLLPVELPALLRQHNRLAATLAAG